MSATEDLRDKLERRCIQYGRLGDYCTMVRRGGLTWTMSDQYDGHLSVTVGQPLEPEQAIALLPSEPAFMVHTCDEDGVGHSECDSCGGKVEKRFNFCPWCGRWFSEGRSEPADG